MNERVFIDQLIDSYYEEIDLNYHNTFYRGQFYWTHVYYGFENREIWRPAGYDETQTMSSFFKIVPFGNNAFNRLSPLINPKLETNEEFIVVRAKIRPVVLITPAPEKISYTIPRKGDKIEREICLVAPLYSIIDKRSGKPKYYNEIVNRIRLLEFPQFFFIPANPAYNIVNSILRLDYMQFSYKNHLDPLRIKLKSNVLEILQEGIEYFINGKIQVNSIYYHFRESLLKQ